MSTAPGRAGRRLVVNGDDFGLAPEVNRAIVRAHRDGILTTTSLMIAEMHASEAVALAKDEPRLGVGLHLVLVQGSALSDPATAAGLVLPDRRFRDDPILAGMEYFFRSSFRRALVAEIRAQLEAFRATGLPLDHVDGHLNVHLHPTVLDVLADLAGELGIRVIRSTHDPLLQNLAYDRRHRVRKGLEAAVFRALAARAKRRLAEIGVVTIEPVFGLHQTGHCDERYLRALFPTLPRGTSELYCHPAESATPEMRRRMPGYDHAGELAALTSPAIRRLVEEQGIELVRHADVVPGGVASPRSARLSYEPIGKSDVPALYRHWNAPDVRLYLWDDLPVPLETVAEVAAQSRKDHAEKGFALWGLRRAGSRDLVGVCGLRNVPGTDRVEILYSLDRTQWGQGLATEAGRAVLTYGASTAGSTSRTSARAACSSASACGTCSTSR